MIHRYYKKGPKLDVANLNEIIVLIDRSETALTEVGLNSWRAGLVGPPHRHDDKEQIFYITSGAGTVVVGAKKYPAKSGSLVYIPARATHQTLSSEKEALSYMLFNFFLKSDKEGHASFADHIEKVKHIRKQQAEYGKAHVGSEELRSSSEKKGKYIENIKQGKVFDFGSNTTCVLIDQAETERCEAVVVSWPKRNKGAMVAHKDKEQTFFILSGSGSVTVGEETEQVRPGDVVFVPQNTPHTSATREENLTYLCLNTYIEGRQYESFEEMYNRVAPGRIERWQSGSESVGA